MTNEKIKLKRLLKGPRTIMSSFLIYMKHKNDKIVPRVYEGPSTHFIYSCCSVATYDSFHITFELSPFPCMCYFSVDIVALSSTL